MTNLSVSLDCSPIFTCLFLLAVLTHTQSFFQLSLIFAYFVLLFCCVFYGENTHIL